MAGRYKSGADISNVVQHPAAENSDALTQERAEETARRSMPKGLKAAEKTVWMRSIPEFVLAGRYKTLYNDFFVEYCRIVARMDRLRRFLDSKDNGWSYTTYGRNGQQHRPRPEAGQYNDDWRKWNTMVNQIGISPATDARFHGSQGDLFGNNPFDQV